MDPSSSTTNDPLPTTTRIQRAADIRRVYLWYKGIFNGPNAKLRKVSRISKLVDKFDAPVRSVLNDLGRENVIGMIKILLETQVFESEQRAKIKFPELFVRSTASGLRASASASASANQASSVPAHLVPGPAQGAVKEWVGSERPMFDFNQSVVRTVVPAREAPGEGCGAAPVVPFPYHAGNQNRPPRNLVPPEPSRAPILYPASLPYSGQHAIVINAQHILEECFWNWAQMWVPAFIQREWDCAAAVELTTWVRQLPYWIKMLSPEAIQLNSIRGSDARLQQILSDVTRLRNTAVHRIADSARGIHCMLVSSVQLANLLRDQLRANLLEDLRRELDHQIQFMEFNKDVLKQQLSREMDEITRKREELNMEEKQLYGKISEEDTANTILAGQLLEESVKKIIHGELEANDTPSPDTAETQCTPVEASVDAPVKRDMMDGEDTGAALAASDGLEHDDSNPTSVTEA